MTEAELGLPELIRQANKNPAALAELRQVLDEHPEIWQQAGDLGVQTESLMLRQLAGANPVIVEMFERKLKAQRAELIPAGCSVIERLAGEQVLLAHLQLATAEEFRTRHESSGNASLKLLAFAMRRCEQSQKRLDQALRSLLDVRRLLPNGAPATRRGPQRAPDFNHPLLRPFVPSTKAPRAREQAKQTARTGRPSRAMAE